VTLSSYDLVTNELVHWFNPRTDKWLENFEWQGAKLFGKMNIGRATIELLRINLQERIEHRRMLMEVGLFTT
jgi:hypothetical protein